MPVFSGTSQMLEEPFPEYSPEKEVAEAAVRLPRKYLDNPKPGPRHHPRRPVHEIYFGDDFGPDFEAAQVATRLSADVQSK